MSYVEVPLPDLFLVKDGSGEGELYWSQGRHDTNGDTGCVPEIVEGIVILLEPDISEVDKGRTDQRTEGADSVGQGEAPLDSGLVSLAIPDFNPNAVFAFGEIATFIDQRL